MTKEQEEAIKDVKNYIHDIISESIDEDGYTRYEISEEEQEFFNNIEKLLNILKEKDKEIEKKDEELEMYKDIKEITNSKATELVKLKQYDDLKKKVDRQDKMIDLMAYSLADYVMYHEYDKCRSPLMIKDKSEELKEYYERKATNEG